MTFARHRPLLIRPHPFVQHLSLPVPAETCFQLAAEVLRWGHCMLKHHNAGHVVQAPAKFSQRLVQLVQTGEEGSELESVIG